MKKVIVLNLLTIVFYFSFNCMSLAQGIETDIPVSNATGTFTIDTGQNKIFLTDTFNMNIPVIDLSTNNVITNIHPLLVPSDLISVNSNTGEVYVQKLTPNPSGLLILDGKTNMDFEPFAKEINFPGNPGSINDVESDPDSNKTFSSGSLNGNGQFWVIEDGILKDTLTLGNDIDEIAICSSSKVIVSEKSSNQVHLLEISGTTAMLTKSRAISDKTSHSELISNGKISNAPIACNPKTKRAYLAGSHDSVIIINTETLDVIKTLAIDNLAKEFEEGIVNDIALNPITNKIYIGHTGNNANKLLVIDGASNKLDEETDLGIDTQISQIRVNPKTNKAYVLDIVNDFLIVIAGSSNPSQNGENNGSNGSSSTMSGTLSEMSETVKDLKNVKKDIQTLEGPTESILNPLNTLIKDTKKFIKKTSKQCKRNILKNVETELIIGGIDSVLQAVDKSSCKNQPGNPDPGAQCFADAAVSGFLPGLEDPLDRLSILVQVEDLCN